MTRLLQPDTEPVLFEGARIIDWDGRPAPVARVGGIDCLIETKPSLLAAGVAFLQPVGEFDPMEWPHSVRIEVDGEERVLQNFTTNPRVLMAAARFQSMAEHGNAKVGQPLS